MWSRVNNKAILSGDGLRLIFSIDVNNSTLGYWSVDLGYHQSNSALSQFEERRAVLDKVEVRCHQVYWTLTMRVQHSGFTRHCVVGFPSEVTTMALLQLGTSKCSTMTESMSFLHADAEIFCWRRRLLLSISLANDCSAFSVKNL